MPALLVVDDDLDICCNLADIFTDLGYRVDTAPSGDIALKKAGQQRYDMSLLDYRMPGMDGLTLCRRLKQLWPGMVALLITGFPGPGLERDALAAGAQNVLPKPVDVVRLLTLVEKVLSPPQTDN